MELCYTKRGIGTYVTEDESKLSMIRKEMADEVVEAFLLEMKELGFTKEELIGIIDETYKSE
jgi:DNA-binding transcriptional regulator YhcF (GntR family)